MAHFEGSFDSKGDAMKKKKSLESAGYPAKLFQINYGKYTPPLYKVYRGDDKKPAAYK